MAESESKPEGKTLSGRETLAIGAGIAGICLGAFFILQLTASQVAHENILAALLFGAAIAIFLSVQYFIAVKHDHPRLHRIFFLSAAMTVGAGTYLWALTIVALVFIAFQLTLTTAVAVLLLALIFIASTLAMESAYASLRERIDAVPRKSMARLVAISACLGLLCALLLIVGIWKAQAMVIEEINPRLADVHSASAAALGTLTANSDQMLSAADPALQARVGQETAAAQEAFAKPFVPMPQPTFTEVLQDKVIENRCASFQGMRALYRLNTIAMQVQGQDSASSMTMISSPVRYKPFDDLMACAT